MLFRITSVNLLIFKVFGGQRGLGNIACDGFIVFSLFGFVVLCGCDELMYRVEVWNVGACCDCHGVI